MFIIYVIISCLSANQTREVSITNCNSAQTVNCSVSTGHSCSYSWTSVVRGGSQKTYSGSTLNLKKVPNGLYTCRASCSVQETTCSVEPVKVDYCSGSEYTVNLYINNDVLIVLTNAIQMINYDVLMLFFMLALHTVLIYYPLNGF